MGEARGKALVTKALIKTGAVVPFIPTYGPQREVIMKKILVMAIIVVFTTAVADATLAVREKCSVNLTALMVAAKSTLSEDGVEKLQQIFANAKTLDSEKASVGSVFFLGPALRPDLQRNEVTRVNKFLKTISNKRLVTCNVVGGGREFKGRGLFRIVYSLEESSVKKSDETAGVAPAGKTDTGSPLGKRYTLKAQKRRPGETRMSGSNEYEIRLDP